MGAVALASLLIAFLWFQSPSVFIPPELEYLQSAARKIYQTRFDEATDEFKHYQKKYPDRPEGYFLEAMVTWWKVLLTLPEGSWQEEFRQVINRIVILFEEKAERNPDLKPVYDLYLAGSYGFLARMHVNNEYWVEAAVSGARAYPVLLKLLERDDGFEDSRLGTGIYRYYASWVPEKFPFLKPFLFFLPEADRARGLADLKTVSESGYLANVEATYFLLMIYQDYEPNAVKAAQLSEGLIRKYPQNPVFILMNAISSAQAGDYQSLKMKMVGFNQSATDNNWFRSLQSAKSWYYTGIGFMKTGERDEAKKSFLNGIRKYRNRPLESLNDYYFRSLNELGTLELAAGNKALAGTYWTETTGSENRQLAEEARKNLKKIGL